MRTKGHRVFTRPGISYRTRFHPFEWPEYEDLAEVQYRHRYSPPNGHPGQCHGLIVGTMRRCDRWAGRGRRYCPYCNEGRRMTHIYKDAASPRLKELLAKAEAGAPEDRLSVVAEIDLARVAAGEAVQLFDKVFEDSSSATPASRAQSIQLMNSALREVANLVQAQARILQHTEDIMTMEQFIWCMETFKRIVRDELGDSPKADEIAEKFDLVQPPSKGVADAAVRVSFT